jgi:flagellar motor switch/type III secretory pathway protein FliN
MARTVPIEIVVEFDPKVTTVRDILNLAPGGVIKMRRSAGENIDVLAGEALVAFGEIAVIESSMGLR